MKKNVVFFLKEHRKILKVLITMKLIVLFSLTMTLQISASVYSQNVRFDINLQDASLKKVFKTIKKQSEFSFLYSDEDIQTLKDINLSLKDASIEEVLNASLQDQDLEYEIFNKVIIVRPSKKDPNLETESTLLQQSIEITGKVTDEKGEALPGANIFVKDTPIGVTTDIDGNFTINVPNEETILVFSFIGYENQEIVVGEKTTIDISLKPAFSALDEVVVVGYGTVKSRDLTGTITSIKGTELSKEVTTSFDQALIGKMAGVYVMPSSGAPGEMPNINIRGYASITGMSNPLWVIDGVPMNLDETGGYESYLINRDMPTSNPLAGIDQSDIERIDVLKDASAAGIYGSRGANGVIIVTTKRGARNSKPQLDVTYRSSFSVFNNRLKDDLTNAAEWKETMQQAAQHYSDNFGLMPWDWFLSDIVNDVPGTFGDADANWLDEIVQTGVINYVGASVNGGGKNSSYRFSGTYQDQTGIVKGTGLNRFSVNGNFRAEEIANRITIGSSFNYSHVENQRNNRSSEFASAINYRPDFPVRDSLGEVNDLFRYPNPLLLQNIDNNSISNRLNINGFAEIKIIDGLNFRTSLLFSNSESKSDIYIPISSNIWDRNYRSRFHNNRQTTVWDNTLNFYKTLDNHNITAMLGASYENSNADVLRVKTKNFPDDDIINNLTSGELSSWEDELLLSGLTSYFGRANYTYLGRYFATVTVRADASSKFGRENQWGLFPSGALAWDISKESFMNSLSMVDLLKLRTSYGVTGTVSGLNSFIDKLLMESTYYSTYTGQAGVVPSNLPNPSIGWESVYIFDAGVDFSLFNNRLYGSLGYYNKRTTDAILNIPTPPETGFSTAPFNVADILNEGWEVEIGGTIIETSDMRWDVSFNIAGNKNTIESLNDGLPFDPGSSRNAYYQEGQSMGAIRGFVTDGYYQSWDEIDALNAEANTFGWSYYNSYYDTPGKLKYKDIDGDGRIRYNKDFDNIGDVTPDFFGGLSQTFTYKNFSLSAVVHYAVGQERLWGMGGSSGMISPNSRAYDGQGGNFHKDFVTDNWTPENPNASNPVLTFDSFSPSDYLIFDASYVRLSSLQLGYKLPKNPFIADASLFLTGSNLFTWTKYPGFDPVNFNPGRTQGVQETGMDVSAYPTARTYTIGVKILF